MGQSRFARIVCAWAAPILAVIAVSFMTMADSRPARAAGSRPSHPSARPEQTGARVMRKMILRAVLGAVFGFGLAWNALAQEAATPPPSSDDTAAADNG